MKNKEFIEKGNIIHNNKYTYDLDLNGEMTNTSKSIIINCPKHGDFYQMPFNHLDGHGCTKCSFEKLSSLKRLPIETLIERFNERWNGKYIYHIKEEEYKNNNSYINVECPNHGIFNVRIKNHYHNGCSSCSCNKKFTREQVLEKLNNIYPQYEYTLLESYGVKDKVLVRCDKHGYFEQKIGNIFNLRRGCANCKKSKGENDIFKYLTDNNIEFEREKMFEDCRNKRKLRFDFYIPSINTLIEYDGKQHFEPIERFGGQKYFEETQENDKIKNEYCKQNEITLVRITYMNKNIEDILSNIFFVFF